MQLKRRQLIRAMAASPVLGLSPVVFGQGDVSTDQTGSDVPDASAQALPEGSLRTVPLKEKLWLIQGAGANVVVAETADSVIVVDGGDREHAAALLTEINALTDNKPVSILFNTNWRPEHTGLNYLLGGTDTRIIAHENTRLWQTAEFEVEWENKSYEPMPEEAQANESFYTEGSLTEGGVTVEYGYMLQAHTDGDIYINFPGQDVLVVSDMLRDHQYPLMDYRTGGWIGGMRDASMTLAELASDTTQVIPAQGGVLGKADLLAQHEMLVIAYELVGDAFRSGWSLEELKVSRPGDVLGADWGDPDLFLKQAYRGTWLHVPGRAVRNVI